jgi:hypothetical protein
MQHSLKPRTMKTRSLLKTFGFYLSNLFMVAALIFSSGRLRAETGDVKAKSDAKKIEAAKESAVEESDLTDFARLSLTGVVVDGDQAAFMSRYQIKHGLSGGLEDLYMERTSKEVTTRIEARGILDNHDYLIKLDFDKEKFGRVGFGYKQFRTWYDGTGGYLPSGNTWIELYPQELGLDRGEIWFEAALTLPDLPVISFNYNHEFREGDKDSLHWGDVGVGLTGGISARKLAPSFRKINEHRDTLDLSLAHSINETAFKVGLNYETTRDENKLYVTRNPGQLIQRSITTTERATSDMYSFYGSTETTLSEDLLFTTGYVLRTFDSDIGGSFIYGSGFDAPFIANFPGRQGNDSGYLDLGGGAEMKQVAVNMNLLATPLKDTDIIAGIRVERDDIDGISNQIQTSGAGAQTYWDAFSDTDYLNVSEILEARYKGIKNWLFYARGGWDQGEGDIAEKLWRPDTGQSTFQRDTNVDRFYQKYTLGATWYALKNLNFATQYYHQINEKSYFHRVDSTSNAITSSDRYPAFITQQNFDADNIYLRTTWRILNNLTSVFRYKFQEGSINSTMDHLDEVQSGRTTTHLFGDTITWSPLTRLYVQEGVNVGLVRTETPINGYSGLAVESKSNYIDNLLAVGYAVDQKTDLQVQYTFYKAIDDYYDTSQSQVPYGAAGEEHGISLSMLRRISKNISWNARYGFYHGEDELYGGNNDYDSHLLYSSVQISF